MLGVEVLWLREKEFRSFLIGDIEITSKVKAVNSRVAKALLVENELNVNLDEVVVCDEKMYSLLLQIQKVLQGKESHNVHQNAVRKYYLSKNKKEFPSETV